MFYRKLAFFGFITGKVKFQVLTSSWRIKEKNNPSSHGVYILVDSVHFSSVQLLSRVWLFATPWTAARQASLSIINSWSLQIESVMSSNHLIFCRPLLLLPSIFPSIRVFSNESALHIRWPKYWSFSSNISPSNEHSGLISFRMDWLDLLAVQGTLKNTGPQNCVATSAYTLHCGLGKSMEGAVWVWIGRRETRVN